MSILSLNNVVKQYKDHLAVNHISFDVPKGSIFGLLGPNGAGKTSLIRIITMITGADEGTVLMDGAKMKIEDQHHIGYLPEERGLYKKMKVGEQLLYLAQLRGMEKKHARDTIMHWLEKFNAKDWWNKKVEELSKGMQQKIQFIATVVHSPKLLILDEPFTGLDPLNTNLIKEEIYRMNREGVSIIFSTHRMEQVEEICEDIVLVNNGQVILEGKVDEVKNTFKENKFRLEFNGMLPKEMYTQGLKIITDSDKEVIVQLEEGQDSNVLLKSVIDGGFHLRSFNEILPSLNEIFIRKVENTNI
jgi:ABC-2 type transport system ATP-binding protein